jgi:hypothetical protein
VVLVTCDTLQVRRVDNLGGVFVVVDIAHAQIQHITETTERQPLSITLQRRIRGVEISFHAFLILSLAEGEW